MVINIEVRKNPNESSLSLMKRFQRGVQERNLTRHAKTKRYSERKTSKLAQKNMALKRKERQKEREKMRKLGKIA